METRFGQLIWLLGKNKPLSSAQEQQVFQLATKYSWTRENLSFLHKRIRQEKVVSMVYHNLAALQQRETIPLLHDLAEVLREGNEQHGRFATQVMPEIRQEIIRILEERGLPFLFLKGSSLEAYSHGYTRQLNDVDLFLQTWDDFFQAAQALQQKGYRLSDQFETPWISSIALDQAHHLICHFDLVRTQDEYTVSLDLHTSPFLVGPTGMLHCKIWERSPGQASHLPTPEDQLLISIAHATNHGYFLMKDLNDAYAILQRHQETFDWDYFCLCAEQSHIAYAASFVLTTLHQEYDASLIPLHRQIQMRRASHVLLRHAIASTSKKSDDRQARSEKIIHILHTLLLEYHRKGVFSSLVTTGQYMGWRWKLSLLNNQKLTKIFPFVYSWLHSSRPLLPPPTGQQVIIVPLVQICEQFTQEQVEDGISDLSRVRRSLAGLQAEARPDLAFVPAGQACFFVRLARAELLLTPVEIFVPSLDAIFLEADVRAIEQLAQLILQAISDSEEVSGVPFIDNHAPSSFLERERG